MVVAEYEEQSEESEELETEESEKDSVDQAAKDKEIIALAKKRYKIAEEALKDIHALALEDLKFSTGDQWPEEMKKDREQDKRPMLTINKLPQQIRQVTNDQRQNRPAIKVSPVDRGADPETAKILQGVIRHIEYGSNAESAYDKAFDGAARMGFGFFRIITDYADAMSFNQEIFIKRIRNPFSVKLDPHRKELDGSDGKYGFIEENIQKDEFKKLYPEHELSKVSDWNYTVANSEGWVEDDSVRVCEYFSVESKKSKIYLLSDGQIVDKEKLAEAQAIFAEKIAKNPELSLSLGTSLEIVDERETEVPVVKWYKIAGDQIIDRTDWAGKWIPIIQVTGDEIDIEGKVTYESLIRHAKGSQIVYNFMASSEIEAISLAPKAPWVATADQIKGYEQLYKDANKKNIPALLYNAHTVDGVLVGPPTRNSVEPAVAAIAQSRVMASDDIKATTGIYDASLGARSNETSGVAIMGRQRQAQTSNFHFVDNFNSALRFLGVQLVDLIPKIYDREQIIRIIGEDGEQKTVPINQKFKDDKGIERIYDLSVGRYDVVIESGPSYATKRQEALASMIELSKAYPALMQVAGDLLVGNMDWDQAKEIQARIKKTIPPNILSDEDAPQEAQIPPELQAQMQQLQTINQQLMQQLQLAKQGDEIKRLQIESDEKIAAMNNDTKVAIEAAKLDAQNAQFILKQQIEEAQRLLEVYTGETFTTQNLNQPGPMGSEVEQYNMDQGVMPDQQPEQF